MSDRRSVIIARVLNLLWMMIVFIGVIILYNKTDISSLNTVKLFNIHSGIITMIGIIALTVGLSLDIAPDSSSKSMFLILTSLTFIGVVSDNISWLIELYKENPLIITTTWLISFLVLPLILYIYWEYLETIFPNNKEDALWVERIMTILVITDAFLLIFAAVSQKLFVMGEDGSFSQGSWWMINYFFTFTINIISIYTSLKKKIPHGIKLLCISFYVLPLIIISLFTNSQQYSYTYVVAFLMEILLFGSVHMMRGIQIMEKEADVARQKLQLAEQEQELTLKKMEIMMTQIQPHFMYNTLTTISGLCEEDPILARDTTDKFADYLRMNVDSLKDTKLVFFEREVDHTKTYLWLEKLRFGKRVNYEFDLEELDFMIPPLTLQPVVENAVKHGICRKKGGGTVWIRSRKNKESVSIIVEDNGIGFDLNKKKNDGREHVGTANVNMRLKMICNGSLKIESEPGKGTKATLTIPLT